MNQEEFLQLLDELKFVGERSDVLEHGISGTV